MRAVIVAAGTGSRLGRLSDERPKGLIEVGGKPLLERSLDALSDVDIDEVTIVIGHLHEAIERAFGSRHRGLAITYVRNDEYASTGSMYSLSCAREAIGSDTILLLESDLLFDPTALAVAIDAPHANVLLAARASGSGDEVFLCVDEQWRLTDLGKRLPDTRRARAVGELVGISRFSPPFLEAMFVHAADEYRRGVTGAHYEECAFAVSRQGHPLHVVLQQDLAWIEIDKPADLERARREILPRMTQPAL